ncbi:MAG: D-aminoacylase [Candidatus Bathyarchaeia archaeon]
MNRDVFDIVIKNGKIFDGTGNPWFRANIGIKNGIISKITRKEDIKAERVIDARGKAVMPGIVDLHSHTDFSITWNNRAKNRLRQGITTDVVGNCGLSSYGFKRGFEGKISGWLSSMAGKHIEVDWNTLAQWRRKLESIGIGNNIVPFIGFGTVRRSVMGDEGEGGERNEPEEHELDEMRTLVEEAMREGAFGLTTGLEYAPQRNAYTEEIISLAKVASSYGGCYMSHIRSEDDFLIEAVEEFIRICLEADIPGCISHHKACNPRVWGKSKETLRRINEARNRGLEIICDTYPWLYVAVRNVGLFFLKPGDSIEAKRDDILRSMKNEEEWMKLKNDAKMRYEEERKWIEETREKLKRRGTPGRIPWDPTTYYIIVYSKRFPELEGRNFTEAAKMLGIEDPWDAMRRLYLADEGTTCVAMGSMDEEDLIEILKAPFTAVSTDASAEDEPRSLHPRGYGTYPLLFERYVRDKAVLSLEEAVRKITSLPAGFLGLEDRGLIREGFWADLVVFDPSMIENRATYTEPTSYPIGISHVLVNGELAVDNGEFTESLSGRVLIHR